MLDQREEARQSKQLLELYLQALEKEGNILSNQKGKIPSAATGEQPWGGGLVCRAAQFPEDDVPGKNACLAGDLAFVACCFTVCLHCRVQSCPQ